MTGRVRQVGNVPHIELVVSGAAKGDETNRQDYYIVGSKAALAEAFVGRLVTIRGSVSIRERKYADAAKSVSRRFVMQLDSIEPAD